MKSHYSIHRVEQALAHADRIMENRGSAHRRACRLHIDCLKWLGRWGVTR